VNDANLPVVDAKRVGADLRYRCFDALSDRCGAGDDFDRAAGVDGNVNAIEWAKAALLDKDGKPDTNGFSSRAAAF